MTIYLIAMVKPKLTKSISIAAAPTYPCLSQAEKNCKIYVMTLKMSDSLPAV